MPRGSRWVVDQTEFAKLADVTTRTVRNLNLAGVLPRALDRDGKELRGRYDLRVAMPAYCNYQRRQGPFTDATESRHQLLRNRKMAAQSEMSELQLQVYKGQLHRADDVEFLVTNQLSACKSRLLAIPSRVTRLLVGKTKFKEIFEIIMTEIRLALRELTGYDRNAFKRQAAEYLERQTETDGNGASDPDA